jgi:anti-anti-sigma factor
VEIDVRKQGKVHVIRMRGQLKLGDPVDELRTALDGVIAEGHTSVVASMGEVPMADSSGIGALVRYQSMLKQKGGAIKLVQPSKLVTQTLKILGLLNMFETFDDEGAAVQSFPDAAAAG